MLNLSHFVRFRRKRKRRRKDARMAMAHLRRVAACRDKLEEVRLNRDEAIIEAYMSGETQRDIARYAGISHQRVQQIVAAGKRHTP